MISIDYREGSKELVPVLSRMGVKVKEEYLAFGDVQFLGKGPEGLLLIGIEYKKLSDLMQSLMDNRLLGHQLPGMMNAYDVNYLLVEGVYSCAEDAGISYLNGRNQWKHHKSQLLYGNLRKWMSTISMLYGVQILETANLLSTAVQVASIYDWWQTPYLNHGSSFYIHQPNMRRSLRIPSGIMKVASTFPGVGNEKLDAIEEKFKSIRKMVNSDSKDWQDIKGIGKGRADKIVEFLTKEEE